MAEIPQFVPHRSFFPFKTAWEDVLAHCETPDRSFAKYGKMTEVHENTHQIHSELRNRMAGNNGNAFYVLNDRSIYFREPSVTLADVASRVAKKGPVFDLYLVASRKWWNRQPLYVLDEAVAYTNGAIAGEQERGVDWVYEADRAREMTVYAWALIRAIEDLDPTYPELEKLVSFTNFNVTRLPDYKVGLR